MILIVQSAVVNKVDPKVTEQFLLTQADVVDASVWFEQGELSAHVTLLDTASITPRELRLRCACDLGLHLTPRHFVCLTARPTAA